MTLFAVLERMIGWDVVLGCSVAVPVVALILHRISGRVRDWQWRLMTRMIVREAPIGTKVTSSVRRGGTDSVLVIEVGNQDRPADGAEQPLRAQP
ncbi:hypothetical protein [Nocardia paucivorans]|uniref:hypothetical protein n=1 Tax=Nocardia paucivorans TaxID=114259 RepID=UPI0002E36593|nr:hypothetical protein [Nocardia paucivorans]